MEGPGARRCFCVSKGRGGDGSSGIARLREELRELKQGALAGRAKAAGADEPAVEEALDAGDPRAALIDLILRHSSAPGDAATAELRAQLATLKQGALAKRAREAGVDEADVEEALDADDPKEALVALILAAAPGVPSAAMRSELQGMKLRALKARAAAAGVGREALADADDTDDIREEVILLILQQEARRGPADRVFSALSAGGEAALDALSSVLDHALDVLEHVSAPRKSRKAALELMERVEEVSETASAEWCDSVSRCSSDRLETLASQMFAVQGLPAEKAASSDCVLLVSTLVDALRECGSVAVQCESVLLVESGEDARLRALEGVRGLSTASLESVSDSEASLFDVLKDHLCGTLSCEERLACLLSVFVLGCRNGVSVVARVDMLESIFAALDMLVAALGAAEASGSIGDALRVCSAVHLVWSGLVVDEAAPKSAPDVRAPFEKRFLELVRPYLGRVAKVLSAESFGTVIAEVVDLRLLE